MSDTHAAETEHIEPPQIDPLEQEAREYGWAPKDEFKGPADKWRPAADYLPWAKQIGRLPKGEFDEIKRQFPAIRQENQNLRAELSEIKTTLNQFVEFSSKAEERAFNRARQEIEGRVEQAAANADPAAAKAAMRELEALKPEVKEVKQPEKPAVAPDPVIQDWMAQEPWYLKDRTLNAYATDVFGRLELDKPGMSKTEMLAETKRLTIDKFPEKFGENPKRNGAASVAEPAGGIAPRKRGKTYQDLPAEAKKACDRFVKMIPGYTQDQYVKDYEWD